jgi:putative ABC transport system permease protein
MPAVVVLGVKDVLGSRTRATFTVGILVLAAATLTFQLVADSSMARYSVTPALVGEEPYPVYAFREGDGAMSPEDTASLIRSVPGVAASYTRVSYDGVAGGIPAQIRAVDGDYAAFDWALTAGRLPATDAEAAVGTVFADAAGVKPGGRLTVTMGERSFDVTVTGVFRSQADNTPPITVRASALAAAGVPIAPPRLFGILPEAGVSTSDLAASLARAADGRLDVVDAAGEVRRDMDEFRPVLYSLSLTMAAIAIGGTLAALMLATEERRREFGVLRAVGMTPGQVALSVTSGALLMAAAGLVLGVPLGFLLTTQLVKVIGDAAGIGTAPWVVPSAVSLALLAPLMAAVAVFGALLPAARAGRLQVVAAIRSE